VRAHIALEDVDQAEALLADLPVKIANAPEIDAARAQLALLKQAAKAGPLDELRAAVAADPSNMQTRFDLATALHANGSIEDAVNELLDMFRQDRDWNEAAAKTQLFTIFDALKPQDLIALNGRRKLSSIIFA
jgi:putative thioredoxin